MTLSVVYDPRYMEWDQWAALMVEAYGAQQLQIPAGEDTWKDFAVGVCAIDSFAKDAVPSPYSYDKWQDWASALINVVTSRT